MEEEMSEAEKKLSDGILALIRECKHEGNEVGESFINLLKEPLSEEQQKAQDELSNALNISCYLYKVREAIAKARLKEEQND